jgi:2-hydroxy-6-oxonona-2,4-dienedioate hydrolase
MTRVLLITLAILFIAGSRIYLVFARDLSAARDRLVGHSKTIATSCGILEYAVVGDGDPILIIHGAGGGFDQGIDMTAALAAHGYRLIAPSRFGYLASSLPANPTTALQSDAYIELLNDLRINKVFVLGISAGEWSALQFAIRHPERCLALALIVPADYLPPNKPNYGGPLARVIFGSDFAAWSALKLSWLMPGAMSEVLLGTKPAVIRAAEPSEKTRVQHVLDHLLPVSARFGGIQFDIKTARTPDSCPIEKVKCSVLTISAEDDSFGTAARARLIAAGVPGGRAVIYTSGGHAMVGRQGEVLQELASFFGRSQPQT